MIRATVLGFLVIGLPLGLAALGLWHAARRRYETRMLRKNPLILAQQGRLARDAAERLVDMRDQLERGEVVLRSAATTLNGIRDHEFFELLPPSLTECVVDTCAELEQRTRDVRKIIEE